MILVWDESAWEDYLWWQTADCRTLKRISGMWVVGTMAGITEGLTGNKWRNLLCAVFSVAGSL